MIEEIDEEIEILDKEDIKISDYTEVRNYLDTKINTLKWVLGETEKNICSLIEIIKTRF